MKLMSSTTLIVLVLLAAGCNKTAPVPAPAAGPIVNPPPPQIPQPAPQRTARTLIQSSPLEIDRKAPFAEFSKRIAQARKDQKILPCGNPELDRLYQLVVSRGFQGAIDTQEVNQQLNKWVNEDTADPIPQIALARAALEGAYQSRGAEYGNIVSQKRLQRFGLLLQDAHRTAQEALSKGADDPEVYRLLIESTYELHLPPNQLASWMEDGPKLYPKYYPLYDLIAKILGERQDATMPEMLKLANQAYEKQSNDEGLEIYTRIAMAVNRVEPKALVLTGFDLERLHAGAKLLLKRYPDAAMFVDFIGVISYLTEDFELGNAVLPEIESKSLDLKQWGGEFRFHQFKERLKLPMPKEEPERRLWASYEGGASLAFIDEGKYLATIPYQGQSSITVWSLTDASLPPTLVQTGRQLGSQLDVDRAGKRLMVYSINPREMMATSFNLGTGRVPHNFVNVNWYKPSFPIVADDQQAKVGRRWALGFFELSEDGKRAVAASRGEVEIFDPATGKAVKRFTAPDMHKFEKCGRQLSPDGKLLALQGEKGFQVWDCVEGTKLFDLDEKLLKTHYILSPVNVQTDRNLMLHVIKRTSGAGDITLANWNPDRQELKHLGPVARRLSPIASLGNDYVACASQGALGSNQELAIYRLSDGKCLRTIQGHFGSVLYASFSTDGQWIATMDRLGPAKLWKIPQEPSSKQ